METQIEELLERSADAVRRRDARALAQLMHPNANQGAPGGERVVGREAIAAQLSPMLATIPRDIEQETVSRQIHFVTPDLAGYPRVKVFVGGCEQWSADSTAPVEK